MTSSPPAPPIWLLIACTSISQLAMTLVLPANTVIMREFGASYGVAQLMLTTFLISVGLGQLAVGFLSDKYGRRPVLVWGLAAFCAGCFVSALAPTVDVLLVGRVLQGLGAAASVAVPRAIVRDSYERARAAKVMSYLLLAVGFVPMIAPGIGGILLEIGPWRSLFFLLAVSSLALMIFVYRTLAETGNSKRHNRPLFTKSAGALLIEPAYIGYITSIAFGTAMYHVFNAGAPFVMSEVLHRDPSDFGFYYAIAASMFLAGSLLSARFTERVGADRMILLALVPIAIGIGLFWLLADARHPLTLFIPAGLLMFSNGLTIPNATTGALSVRTDLAGTAAGLSGFVQFLVGAVSTMVVGFALTASSTPLLVALTLCAGLTAAGAALGIRSRRQL